MRPSLGKACAAGLAGTSVVAFLAYGVAPWLTDHGVEAAAALAQWFGSMRLAPGIACIAVGTLVLPSIYALFLQRVLTGSPVARGAFLGTMLGGFATVLALAVRPDVLRFHDGGASATLATFAGLVIYGLILGVGTGRVRSTGLRRAISDEASSHMGWAG